MKEIWPEQITDQMDVQDYFLLIYYDDVDAAMGYIVVDYEAEVKRLGEYESTEYIGYYGFTYAITDGKSTIIYVELECPHTMRKDYRKYIPEEYLPEGIHMEKVSSN